MSSTEEDAEDCPICCNDLDLTDRSIQYCACGFQPCLWCYHHILEEATKESLPARCPNCRSEYDQNIISMQHIDAEKLEEEKKKLREKDRPKGAGGSTLRVPRASLTNVRVVQPNLVYAVGIPMDICHEETLKSSEFFGQFGKTVKVSVNRSNQYASAMARHGPTGSAYVTYKRVEDALRCIKQIDGALWRGKPVKACFGTTKYCNAFLKGVPCNNPECLYLHDLADDDDCLTKEEVAAGLLPARFLAMGATNTFKPRLTINLIPNAQTAAAQAAAAAAAAAGQPPAAIAAAAAAAGGISRALPPGGTQLQQAVPSVPSQQQVSSVPRVLTVPSAAIPAGRSASHGTLQHQDSSGNNGSYGSSMTHVSHMPSHIATSPTRGVHTSSGSFTGGSSGLGAPPGAQRGLWASAAASTAMAAAALPPPVEATPPPPPSDKQEWPTLAAPPSAAGTAATDNGDGAQGEGSGRPPSMAEQLARAHSNAGGDPKGTRQVKKLLPLASPGKLKPLLGKTLQRTTSPVDVHASALTSDDAQVPYPAQHAQHAQQHSFLSNGGRNGDASSSLGAVGQGFEDLSLGSGIAAAAQSGGPPPGFGSGSSADPLGLPKPAARGPPPGFGGPSLLSQQQQQQVSQHDHHPQQPSKVAPPPGFGNTAAPGGISASLSAHCSMDSGAQLAGAPSSGSVGGYSPFIGGSALFDAPILAPQVSEQRSVSVGSSGASRRQKSRFAFANAEEDAMNSAAGSLYGPPGGPPGGYYNSTGSNNNNSGGIPMQQQQQQQQQQSHPSQQYQQQQHSQIHPPASSSPGQQQPSPQDASAFFKSLFPGANINIASAVSPPQQAQQQPPPSSMQRLAAPPGFNVNAMPPPTAGSAPPPQHAQHPYNPLSGMFPSSSSSVSHSGGEQSAAGGAALAPGLALLRQLQGGGQPQIQPHGVVGSGDPSSGFGGRPAAPPGYGGAPQPPPGFGMRM